jgi:polysaccharide pyruvyl transferase WcaK-like protein
VNRARQWLARVRLAPIRVEDAAARSRALEAHLGQLGEALDRESTTTRNWVLGLADLERMRHDVLAECLAELAQRLDQIERGLAERGNELDAARQEIGGVVAAVETASSAITSAVTSAVTSATTAAIASATDRTDARIASLVERIDRTTHRVASVMEAVTADGRDLATVDLLAAAPTGPRRAGLSVLIATWNHVGWLPEAIESARRVLADMPAAARGEILVLDDGSTDGTSAMLAAGDHPDLRVIVSPRNLGLSRARNVLLRWCTTDHAVILDADNRLLADGVRAAYEVAVAHVATIAYGHVITSTDAGTDWYAYSHVPTIDTIRSGECFDSMAVVDVARVEALGGYGTWPALAGGTDDIELLHRVLRRGALVAFVPVVVGRYRLAPLRHSAGLPAPGMQLEHLRRAYFVDDPSIDDMQIIVAHPDVGVLWRTAAVGPDVIDEPLEEPVARSRRVLVVTSGGVGNLGDDAIADRVIDRIRTADPDAEVEVVSDRDVPALSGPPVAWSGTVLDLWNGLPPDDVAAAATAWAVDPAALAPRSPGRSLLDPGSFDLVVIAGGGFLATPFVRDLLVPRVAIAAVAHVRGVPVVWSGQGVGPLLDDELGLVRAAASRALAFGCRDAVSADLIGPGSPGSAVVVGDDASDVAVDTDAARCLLHHRRVGERYVVLHLRSAGYAGTVDSDFARLADTIDDVAAAHGAEVIVVCIDDNPPHEVVIGARLAAAPRRVPWHVLDLVRRPEAVRGVLAGAWLVVTHSFHLALWSRLSDRPTALIAATDYYRGKIAAIDTTWAASTSVGFDAALVDRDALEQVVEQFRPDPSTAAGVVTAVDRWWRDVLGSGDAVR